MDSKLDTIIIGGGMAGLSCAHELCSAGRSCLLLEASEKVGGRVCTNVVDGFVLDRGFQVLLTAYPEAEAILDYDKLRLRSFEPGALIRFGGRFHRLSDPWRRPQHLVPTALSQAATLTDKLRIAKFRKQTTHADLEDIYNRPERATIDLLRDHGFSDIIIERFFRPFLGGVFLDRELRTSSRMCEFVFRMFSLGDAALPEMGMGEIPLQLARQLPSGVVRTLCPVVAIDGRDVVLSSGERLSASAIVVATEAPASRQLLADTNSWDSQSVHCLYFAADDSPVNEAILVLNGDGEGPINNLCVPSQVCRSYAPRGKSLISVTVLGDQSDHAVLLKQVFAQLAAWYGESVNAWQHLKTYQIKYALPTQTPPALQPVEKQATVRDGVFVCGDHCDTASINGAIASGRRAAGAALEFFSKN